MRPPLLSLALCSLIAACGGSAPQPASAEDAEQASPAIDGAPEDAAEAEPAGDASGDEAATSSESSESASPPSPEDLQKVLQAVLDDPELSRYLKVDSPGRDPVKLHGPDLPEDLKLLKGGSPVSIVDEPESPKQAVLVITTLSIEGNFAKVAYRFDAEGIRGSTRVSKKTGRWELKSSRIVEK